MQQASPQIPPGYGPDDEIDHEAPDPVYLQLCAILLARIAVRTCRSAGCRVV
ncbi:hypothetical protein EKD16_06790 [Streptomonospora litoralis]|uniref:Uncharacterized protein n=1 Tax=Streptomonospora litoralis TaxID=2498135 RepID=A0A4P6PYC0_9ACTN|nr:hypothetical protein EKD16_06790 [Streptomonospora litoralis]